MFNWEVYDNIHVSSSAIESIFRMYILCDEEGIIHESSIGFDCMSTKLR